MRGISVGFLNWVVCGTAAYAAFKSVELEKTGWVWVFGIIALLFNLIIPIHSSFPRDMGSCRCNHCFDFCPVTFYYSEGKL